VEIRDMWRLETIWEIYVREWDSAKGPNANTKVHLRYYKTWGIS